MEKIIEVPDYKFDWKTAALTYDNSIVRDLIMATIRMALSDFKTLGDNKIIYMKWVSNVIARKEVCDFFNSSFFRDIVDIYFPDLTQEQICRKIQRQEYTKRQLSEYERRFSNKNGKKKKKP